MLLVRTVVFVCDDDDDDDAIVVVSKESIPYFISYFEHFFSKSHHKGLSLFLSLSFSVSSPRDERVVELLSLSLSLSRWTKRASSKWAARETAGKE